MWIKPKETMVLPHGTYSQGIPIEVAEAVARALPEDSYEVVTAPWDAHKKLARRPKGMKRSDYREEKAKQQATPKDKQTRTGKKGQGVRTK